MTKIYILSPKKLTKICSTFNITGFACSKTLQSNSRINNRLYIDFLDIKGHTFMGSTLCIRNSLFNRLFSRLFNLVFFSEIIILSEANLHWIRISDGCFLVKIIGQNDEDAIHIPLFVKQLLPEHGLTETMIFTCRGLPFLIESYKSDLSAYDEGIEEIMQIRERKIKEMNQEMKNSFRVSDVQLNIDIYKIFEQLDGCLQPYIFAEEDQQENELFERYKAAIEWRGPACGARVGQINGFDFRVWSNDHDRHFHVIHSGRGIDARFSFPDINLINYKNHQSQLSVNDIKMIKKFFQNEKNMNKLQMEFDRCSR